MEAWGCQIPPNGSSTMYVGYNYTAEPSVLQDGYEWGRITGSFNGLIRVDGAQVLYHGTDGQYVPGDTTLVLYDFDLTLGDTAYWDEYYGFGYTIVTEIDTLTLLGRQRRLFTMDNGDRWLEGIGSLMGLLRAFWQTPLGCGFETFTYCATYLDEDSLTYTICSDLILGIEGHPISKERIFPNPSSGTFTLDHVSPNKPYRLTDARGIEVSSGRTTEESTTIRIPNAVPGLYVLDVDGTRSKVIVQ